MGSQCFRRVESLESPSLNIVDPDSDRRAQGFKAGSILSFALLYQSQTFTQYLAGVLVATTADQLLNQRSLMVRQHNIAGRHFALLLNIIGRLCQYDHLGSIRTLGLAQVVPNPSATAMLVQRAAFDQGTEMLLERIPAGTGQLDGIANRDAAMLAGELDDL